MASLRIRLFIPWLLLLMVCATVGFLLFQLYELSSSARIGRAEAVVARTCDLIRDRYTVYASDWHGPTPPHADQPLREDLAAAVSLALARFAEVEGGIWQAGTGSLAYAYPTYPGEGRKTDLPQAEEARISALNARAARDERHVGQTFPSRGETLLLEACPLGGPLPGLTAWTMTRVRATLSFERLGMGLFLLIALVLGGGAWMGALVEGWSRRVRAIEAGLAQAGAVDGMPALAPTGNRELDQIVDALNDAGHRLRDQRRRSDELSAQVTASARLAGLGRVAAGVAHEVRNPLAAMRLRAENALASADPARPRIALADILDQVARVDALVTELLAMTQRQQPDCHLVDLPGLLGTVTAAHAAEAERRGVTVHAASDLPEARLDPGLVGRILDNLLRNALRHTPQGGDVHLHARAQPAGRLHITVADTGPGIEPGLRAALFEPFGTGHAEGLGLGLAIARELAASHGGTLTLQPPGTGPASSGAVFLLDLPLGA